MAKATTKAKTRTHPRLRLLKLQVMSTLRELLDISERTQGKIDNALNKKWIETFKIFACDDDNQKVCELILKIDWSRHTFNLDKNSTVTIDKKWRSNIMPNLEESVKTFKEILEEENLTADYTLVFSKGLDIDEISQTMNFIDAPIVDWKATPISHQTRNKLLSELGVEVKIADE